MKTFFKICPPEFVLKHDIQEGITIFTNGSAALWMHLDSFDEQSLRGLEFNSGCLDQVEEIKEDIYLVFDARIGRWDGAKVPDGLLLQATPSELWGKIPYTFNEVLTEPKLVKLKDALIEKSFWPCSTDGRPRVKNFLDVLCNPDNEFHWVYRRYHPESIERKKNHFYIERQTDEELNDPETIENMKDRDPEWVDKYYLGKWGRSKSQIHKIHPFSIIDPDKYNEDEFNEFIALILKRGALYRVMDHGETAPTCVLWFAAINKIHICYREYYVPDQTISFHRQGIFELSRNPLNGMSEEYVDDLADPSIFYKIQKRTTGSKNYIKTSVADEYMTDEIDGPPIHWSAADNNELATRNRINELLKLSHQYAHPLTRESPAPNLYFIKQSEKYPFGCDKAIIQTQSQRRKSIGSMNGRVIYSDDREDSIDDHAYDPVRYYVAEHGSMKPEDIKEPPRRSFANFERIRNQKPRLLPNF